VCVCVCQFNGDINSAIRLPCIIYLIQSGWYQGAKQVEEEAKLWAPKARSLSDNHSAEGVSSKEGLTPSHDD